MKLNEQSQAVVTSIRAASTSLQSALLREDDGAIAVAIESGANPALDRGRALVIACATSDPIRRMAHVTELLRVGATDRATGGDALCCAILSGDAELVQLLLEHGADAQARDNRAIRIAVDRGFLHVADVLLRAGANLRAAPPNRLTAYEVAFTSQHWRRAVPWAIGKH